MLVENKVTASSTLALVAGVILAVLNAVLGNSQLLGSLPAGVQGVIVALGPALLTLAAGVAAPHTARPDLAPTLPAGTAQADPPVVNDIPPVDAPGMADSAGLALDTGSPAAGPAAAVAKPARKRLRKV